MAEPFDRDVGKPRILGIRTVARSKLFEIEAVRLQFSNGSEAEYERVSSGKIYGAVVVVPMPDPETVLFVKEYAVGFDRYELGLPKGLVQCEESIRDAANRELMEEIGFSAGRLDRLSTLSIASGFLCYATDVVLATDLKPNRQVGDEPEELAVVPWPIRDLGQLITSGEITDARSLAALYLAKEFSDGLGGRADQDAVEAGSRARARAERCCMQADR